MKSIQTSIKDLWILQSQPIQDNRGFFAECFTQRELNNIGHTKPIVQVNHSMNKEQGTIRGMHFQYPPMAEIKIVKCVHGSILDVAVDIRKNSPTFMQHHAVPLSAENMTMLYIPEGFAHGFQTLTPNTEVIYFTTTYYSPEHLGGFRYDDPRFAIEWPLPPTELSQRDAKHPWLDDSFTGIDPLPV
jgi:dTDP-4-dehydrorhamnose 3,5-epimerase